jgi:hypothetical protein
MVPKRDRRHFYLFEALGKNSHNGLTLFSSRPAHSRPHTA